MISGQSIEDLMDSIKFENWDDAFDRMLKELGSLKDAEEINDYTINMGYKSSGETTITVKVTEKDAIKTLTATGKVVLDNPSNYAPPEKPEAAQK